MSVPNTPVVPSTPNYIFLSDGSPFQAHYTHYYDDGNIVFIVEKYVFRLFRSVLARRSDVLRDLFSLPQPSTTTEPTLDGLPVIRLQDSMIDFAAFLDFIHPPANPPSWATVPRWRALFGALRIAQKYGVDDIEIQALKGLEDVLPTTAETFERSMVYAGLSTAVEVVNLSRELETEEFLPLAFYRLATLSSANIGSVQTMVALSCLSKDDLVRLHVGRAALQEAVMNQVHMVPDMNPAHTHTWRCRGNQIQSCPKRQFWSSPKRNWTPFFQFPLEELRLRVRNRAFYEDYCDACSEYLMAKAKLLQSNLYANLAVYFRLTG